MATIQNAPVATTLTAVRRQILDILHEAIEHLSLASVTAKKYAFYNGDQSMGIDQAIEALRTAESDLEFFWSNISSFSASASPKYMNIVLYRFSVDSMGI